MTIQYKYEQSLKSDFLKCYFYMHESAHGYVFNRTLVILAYLVVNKSYKNLFTTLHKALTHNLTDVINALLFVKLFSLGRDYQSSIFSIVSNIIISALQSTMETKC